MVRVRTVAALVSFLAGAWSLTGAAFYGLGEPACVGNPGAPICRGTPFGNVFVLALALLMEINSVVCLLGPRQAFYASTVLSIFLAASIAPYSSLSDPVAVVALGLVGASFVLSLLAARRRTAISEQSNPMNLPVFG